MKLIDYLRNHGLTVAEFSRRIGAPQQTAHDWTKGVRIPRREMMARIREFTDDEVQPNDFHSSPKEAAE